MSVVSVFAVRKITGMCRHCSDALICRQVSNRDKELRDFASRYNKIVFVSGTKSSNGKMLYLVCKAKNPNSYFISHPSEINPDWFGPEDSIGICGATSTPMWLMEDVKKVIQRLNGFGSA